MFLSLPGSYFEAKVTGKRVKRGGGYGLEVPCKYCRTGQERLLTKKLLIEHTAVINKCLGKSEKVKKNVSANVLFIEVNVG